MGDNQTRRVGDGRQQKYGQGEELLAEEDTSCGATGLLFKRDLGWGMSPVIQTLADLVRINSINSSYEGGPGDSLSSVAWKCGSRRCFRGATM